MSKVLKVHTSYWHELPDVGMFWDFGSLFQKPRSAIQEELFNKGLAASNVWYGSSQSTVWKASQSTKSCCISLRLFLTSSIAKMPLTVIATVYSYYTSQRGHFSEVV